MEQIMKERDRTQPLIADWESTVKSYKELKIKQSEFKDVKSVKPFNFNPKTSKPFVPKGNGEMSTQS